MESWLTPELKQITLQKRATLSCSEFLTDFQVIDAKRDEKGADRRDLLRDSRSFELVLELTFTRAHDCRVKKPRMKNGAPIKGLTHATAVQ